MSSFAIETRKLTKRFGNITAVDNLDLQIKAGIVYGFLGPNGCGKTTTLRMLCGVLTPSSGDMLMFGDNAFPFSEAMRNDIGYMSQRFSLYNELSSFENLKFYAGMYALEGKERDLRIEEVMELTNLNNFRDTPAGSLSGGWRQRLALCAAIMHRPKILFLDEPTSGVDPVSGRLFWEIVYNLASEGVSVIVSTHSMNEAEHCDEVSFLYEGKSIRNGSPADLRATFPGHMITIASKDPTGLSRKLKSQSSSKLESYIYGNEVRIRIDGDEKMFEGYDFNRVEPTLEDLFVYLTEHGDVAEN